MHTRSAYIRRSRKVQRLKSRLAIVGFAGVAACTALLLVRSPGPLRVAMLDAVAAVDAAPAPAAAAPLAAPSGQGRQAVRRVFPYSVVPGGVAGGDDIKRMIRTDKVVARHYAAFDADKARALTVAAPRAVYVSYRKGDQVFWTKGRHTLAAGETVLSDGSSEIRGRCGNRISDTAQLPVEANGPTEQELDSASEETQDPSVQNVSFVPGADQGGQQAFSLHNYGNVLGGVQSASAAPAPASMRASPGLGTPLDSDMLNALVAGSRLLASNDGAGSGTGTGGSGSGAPVTAPADSGSTGTGSTGTGSTGTGDTGTGNTGTGDAGTGNTGTGTGTGDTGTGNTGSGVTGDTGTGNTGTGNTGTGNTGTGGTGTGGTGTGNQPAAPTAPTTPGTPATPAAPTTPATPDGGTPTPPSIPEVLLPTAPIVTPAKPEGEGGKDSTNVPEPGTVWLSGAAFAALLLARRRGRKA